MSNSSLATPRLLHLFIVLHTCVGGAAKQAAVFLLLGRLEQKKARLLCLSETLGSKATSVGEMMRNVHRGSISVPSQ